MIKNARVYVVTMYRYGDREAHSYVLGVYSTKTIAETEAVREKDYCGGKYVPEIIEMPVDDGRRGDKKLPAHQVVMKLEHQCRI